MQSMNRSTLTSGSDPSSLSQTTKVESRSLGRPILEKNLSHQYYNKQTLPKSIPVPELNLPTGYYLVRSGKSWSVARWKPNSYIWLIPWKNSYQPGHWDEVGRKVA